MGKGAGPEKRGKPPGNILIRALLCTWHCKDTARGINSPDQDGQPVIVLGVFQKAVIQYEQRLGSGKRRACEVGYVEHSGCNAPFTPLPVWKMGERVLRSLLFAWLPGLGQTLCLKCIAPIVARNAASALTATRLGTLCLPNWTGWRLNGKHAYIRAY